jgi:hypothetical protein
MSYNYLDDATKLIITDAAERRVAPLKLEL